MALPSAQLVIFDLGGTTVQLSLDVAQTFEDAFNAHGASIPHDQIAAVRGASKRDAVSRLIRTSQLHHLNAAVIYDEFQRRLMKELTTANVDPITGVEETFAVLQSAGIYVVLTTGFDTVVTRYLMERLGWTNRLDGVATADDVAAGRPAPDMIWHSMQLVNVTAKDRVVVVGDTVNDIKAGRRAGVGAVVAVLTGAHDRARLDAVDPSVILPSAADVPAWLGLAAMS